MMYLVVDLDSVDWSGVESRPFGFKRSEIESWQNSVLCGCTLMERTPIVWFNKCTYTFYSTGPVFTKRSQI